jgi:hypothetical protein
MPFDPPRRVFRLCAMAPSSGTVSDIEENAAASHRDAILEVRAPVKEETKPKPKKIAVARE